MTSYPHVELAEKYIDDVLSGKIPACKWVKLACKRHLNDLKASKRKDYPYKFDPLQGEKICAFAERMPHTKGQWMNKPIQLEPWQCFLLAVPFGWVRKSDGMRRFREIYAEIPRKNAKSTIAAIIGLYMLALDGEGGAEVYSGATTEKQAWEVFRPAKLMAEKSPGFATRFGIEVNASNIHILDNAARFEPVIGKPGDGASPHCAIVDEYHEHPTPELYDTMLTGMGARSQPMLVVITTAGTNIAGPCYDKRSQVCKILDGVFEGDTTFGIIYTIDEGDDWTDINTWKKANPNFGVSVFEDFLQARLDEAVQRANRQNIIKCKHLNVWNNARSAWMNMEALRRCVNSGLQAEDFTGEPCHVGLDLASRIDLASSAKVFSRMEEGKRHYYYFGRHYAPEEMINEPENTHYQGWEREGWLTSTEGNEIDFATIEEDILSDSQTFRMAELAFDPWQATNTAQRLQGQGANCIEFRMTVQNLSPAMKELEAAILSGRFHYDGDPVFTWAMSNVVSRVDEKDNVFPTKEKNTNAKIDPAVALLMAIGRAMISEGPQESVYESRGFIEL